MKLTCNNQLEQKVIRLEPSGYELVWIKGGTFMMGSNEDDWEQPVHEVTIPYFYMGRYPVTKEQYSRFLNAIGCQESEFCGELNFNDRRDPAVGVSWHDAKEYAKWAGMQLPSEAQWEYACRAGTTTRYYTGDLEAELNRAGWYRKNSNYRLHPVGEKEPNAFGLYDMHGNVWEWCEDHWHHNYEGAPDNCSAWVDFYEGGYRVVRGGSWSSFGEGCRTTCRDRHEPINRFLNFGFRLVYLPGQLGEPGQ